MKYATCPTCGACTLQLSPPATITVIPAPPALPLPIVYADGRALPFTVDADGRRWYSAALPAGTVLTTAPASR